VQVLVSQRALRLAQRMSMMWMVPLLLQVCHTTLTKSLGCGCFRLIKNNVKCVVLYCVVLFFFFFFLYFSYQCAIGTPLDSPCHNYGFKHTIRTLISHSSHSRLTLISLSSPVNQLENLSIDDAPRTPTKHSNENKSVRRSPRLAAAASPRATASATSSPAVGNNPKHVAQWPSDTINDPQTLLSFASDSKTGFVFDPMCLKHSADYHHVEGPHRARAVYSVMEKHGLLQRSCFVPCRKATLEELQTAHDVTHVNYMDGMRDAEFPNDAVDSETEDDNTVYPGCKWLDTDTYVNKLSPDIARVNIGGLIELSALVAQDKLQNGFALIRPPGHHAEHRKSMGFCLYNNVAVATNVIRGNFGVERVAIIDMDVHHGNGTQDIFERDPNVLYFSIHRHEDGNFYPYTGAADEVGTGPGEGTTINMALPTTKMGDKEYMRAWDSILIPVLREFQPDLLYISAGFDCLGGDPLGGMKVTPNGYGHLARKLMDPSLVKNGRVIIALEGGYNAGEIAQGATCCMQALLGDDLPDIEPIEYSSARESRKHDSRVGAFNRAIVKVKRSHSQFWKCFGAKKSIVCDTKHQVPATPIQKPGPSARRSNASSTPVAAQALADLAQISASASGPGVVDDSKHHDESQSASHATPLETNEEDELAAVLAAMKLDSSTSVVPPVVDHAAH
jgi:acetoin utilization deacetylase AcuC-like enzyme